LHNVQKSNKQESSTNFSYFIIMLSTIIYYLNTDIISQVTVTE